MENVGRNGGMNPAIALREHHSLFEERGWKVGCHQDVGQRGTVLSVAEEIGRVKLFARPPTTGWVWIEIRFGSKPLVHSPDMFHWNFGRRHCCRTPLLGEVDRNKVAVGKTLKSKCRLRQGRRG